MRCLFIIFFTLAACSNASDFKELKVEVADAEQDRMIREAIEKDAPELADREKDLAFALDLARLVHTRTEFDVMDYSITSVNRAENVIRILTGFEGWRHLCGGLGITYLDVLRAYGFKARIVQLFSNGPDGHVTVEVEVGGRWIAVDPTFNAVFTNETGEPLSFGEAFDRLHMGQALHWQYIGGTTKRTIERDYYFDYELLFFQGRALPEYERSNASWETIIAGEERF